MKNITALYKKLYLIRYTELLIAQKYDEWIFRCPVHLSIGQEAVAVGVCDTLTTDDKVFSSHRSHAHYLAKGGNLKQLFAEILGKSSGCSKGQGGSMHLIDTSSGFIGSTSIIAGTIPVATGYALGQKIDQSNNITVTFFGDGAIESGITFESLNWAATHALPILFCLENNNYACYTQKSIRQSINYEMLCSSLNIDYYYIANGHDILSIQEQTAGIISKMRASKKPAFISFDVLRRYEHCGHKKDDHLEYRVKNELETWDLRDPVQHFKMQNILSSEDISNIEFSVSREVNQIFKTALEDQSFDERRFDEYLYF